MFKQKDVTKTANLLNLSKKDQDLLVEKMRKGSLEERAVAKQILLTKSEPVVAAISRKYIAHDVSLDRLVEQGNKGLLKAVKKYDTSKRYRFIVYATWWIRVEIHKLLSLPVDPDSSFTQKP